MIYAASTDGVTGQPVWVVDGPEVRVGDEIVVIGGVHRVREITAYDFTPAPHLRLPFGEDARVAHWAPQGGITLAGAGRGTYRILPRIGEDAPAHTWGPQ